MTITVQLKTAGVSTPAPGLAEHLRRDHHRDWLDLITDREHHAAVHHFEHVEHGLGLLVLDHVHEPVSGGDGAA